MTLAVYTTIYPGGEPYLPDWHRSLRAQTDQDFQLWIGLDNFSSAAVEAVLGTRVEATWVVAEPDATPASVRQQALARIVRACDGVVLVDSDDRLHPTRVAAARAALQTSDLAGCALRLVDQGGHDLDDTFGLPPAADAGTVLPRNNVFGFSNSAFRSALLQQCLPIPRAAVLVDWFLATQAWLLGARLSFDAMPRMDYRQHPANTARVRGPFGRDQVVSDTALVRRHFQLLQAAPVPGAAPDRARLLAGVIDDVEEFHRAIVLSPDQLDRYVAALNALKPPPLWWSCVAYPALGPMWRRSRN